MKKELYCIVNDRILVGDAFVDAYLNDTQNWEQEHVRCLCCHENDERKMERFVMNDSVVFYCLDGFGCRKEEDPMWDPVEETWFAEKLSEHQDAWCEMEDEPERLDLRCDRMDPDDIPF